MRRFLSGNGLSEPVSTSRRKFIKGAAVTSAAAAGLMAMPHIARSTGPKVTIKASHVEARLGQTNQTLLHMAELVNSRTNGDVVIEAYPDGMLSGGSGQVGIDQLIAGAVQMVPTTTAYFATLEPKLSVLSLPFLFGTYDAHYSALTGEPARLLGELLAKDDLVTANWWPRTFRQLWNSKQNIATVDDMRGLRIRTMDNPLYVDTFEALGARPVPMAWGEVYTALQLGAIDGVEPDLSNGYLTKLHEVCRHVTLWNYSNDAIMVVYNKQFWDGLDEEVKDVLVDAGNAAFEFKVEIDQDLNAEAEKAMKDEGVEFVYLTPDELAPFQEAVQPVWDKYRESYGTNIMDALDA